MIEILHIASQILGLCFFIFIGYGAFLIVQDKDREWKARYGNRWIIGPAEKERLDKLYAERMENKKSARRVNLSKFKDNRSE